MDMRVKLGLAALLNLALCSAPKSANEIPRHAPHAQSEPKTSHDVWFGLAWLEQTRANPSKL
jgi:hypothetical protein